MTEIDDNFTQQQGDTITIATKLSRFAAERLERIAQAKGMTKYELIQMVCDTLIRYMDDRHNLTAEMEQAMSIFEHMVGWAQALNLADPTVQKEVVQAVYILQDANGEKKGLRVSMVSKPFFGLWDQTENVMDIFERIFNVCMPELYMKLFRAKIILECSRVSEVINHLVDAEVFSNMNDQYRRDFEETTKPISFKYGDKTKAHGRRTPDSLASDKRIKQTSITFDDYDRETAKEEAEQ